MSHDVLFAARDDNDVVTLTLDDATGLVVGESVHVYNVGYQIDGHHTLTGVDLGENQVTFTDNGATFAEVTVTGILVEQVTWIDLEDLELFIGTLSDADDIAYGEECVNAANDWAYGRRRAAGYKDNPTVTPSARAKQGTVLYAGALFRE